MHRFQRHLRRLLRVEPGRPALLVGLRAAVAVTFPFSIFTLADLPGAGWTGLTGLLVTLADRGGAYHVRARIMGTVTVLGALVGGLAALAGGNVWSDALLLLLGVAAASFTRCYGETAGSIGGQLAVIFVASLGAPGVGLDEALGRGQALLFGGAWAMVQGLLLWPVRPYRPLRKAVARVYDGLADAAMELARLIRERPPQEEWTAAAARHAPLRLHIEEARETLAATRVGRADESRRGHHLLVLLEMTEPSGGMLLALGSSMEVACAEDRLDAEAGERAALACEGYAVLARKVATVTRDPTRRKSQTLVHRVEAPAALPSPVGGPLTRLRDYIGVAVETVTAMANGRPSPVRSRPLVRRPRSASLLQPLREGLQPESLVLRHALRAGLVATTALVITRALGLGQAHWVVLAAIGILQPYSVNTEERALQRGLGTLFGGMLAAGLAGAIDNGLILLLVLFLLTAISVSLLPLNFGAFQILLTPDLLLLATLNTGDWSVALERTLGVLIACTLAVLGVWFLWPTTERRRFPDAAAAMLRADGHYLRTVARGRSAADGEVNDARRDFGLALLEAEASFERLMAEFRGPTQQLEPAMALLTYARRLAAGVTALREEGRVVRPAQVLQEVAHEASGALDSLAHSLRDGKEPPGLPRLPAPHATDDPVSGALLERVPRQLGILHGAVARLCGERVLQVA